MGNLEIEEFTPAELVQTAIRRQGLQTPEPSLPVAIGQRIACLGQDLVKRTVTPICEGGICEDINTVYANLDQKGRIDLLRGLGAICLGVAVVTIEDLVVNGWSDEALLARYNYYITGTPLQPLSPDDFQEVLPENRPGYEVETGYLREAVKDNSGMVTLLKGDCRGKLPCVLDVFLKIPTHREGLGLILPFYMAALEHLRHIRSSQSAK